MGVRGKAKLQNFGILFCCQEDVSQDSHYLFCINQ